MVRLCCFIFCILYSVPLWAKPVMQWYTSHWPPYRISEGAYAGQGSFDLMLTELINALPQYQHKINQIHLARIVKVSASTQEEHCTFGLRYTPEREKRAYFSQPAGLLPNLAINSLKGEEKLTAYGAQQQIKLHQLVKEPDILGLIENDRAYPAVIAKEINNEGSNLGGSSMVTMNPAQLLAAKRVDYVVDYPNRLRYFVAAAGLNLELEFRAIADIPSFSYTYVSCSRTATGQRWIKDIDQVLTELKQKTSYKNAMYRWFSQQEQQVLAPHYAEFQQSRDLVPEQAETRFSR